MDYMTKRLVRIERKLDLIIKHTLGDKPEIVGSVIKERLKEKLDDLKTAVKVHNDNVRIKILIAIGKMIDGVSDIGYCIKNCNPDSEVLTICHNNMVAIIILKRYYFLSEERSHDIEKAIYKLVDDRRGIVASIMLNLGIKYRDYEKESEKLKKDFSI